MDELGKPLTYQYYVCCNAGFNFTETEFRRAPLSRRAQYLTLAIKHHEKNK